MSSRSGRARRCALLALTLSLAQMVAAPASTLYKCTTAAGALIYSDRPCAAGSDEVSRTEDVIEQKVSQLPGSGASGPTLPSATSIAQRCESPSGTPLSMDAALTALPKRQQEAFEATLRGVALSGIPREMMQASTLHLDARQTLVWCLPKPGAPYAAYLVEANGHVLQLHRSGKVETHNDANDPITLADRCSELVSTCYQPGQSGHSIDQCFATAPTCPTGYLDPASSCCSLSSKAAYQRERAAGTDPLTASTRALFGR